MPSKRTKKQRAKAQPVPNHPPSLKVFFTVYGGPPGGVGFKWTEEVMEKFATVFTSLNNDTLTFFHQRGAPRLNLRALTFSLEGSLETLPESFANMCYGLLQIWGPDGGVLDMKTLLEINDEYAFDWRVPISIEYGIQQYAR